MNIRGKIEIGITIIIMILIVVFTNIISVDNQGILIQEPSINFLPVFLNSGFFLTVIFLLFLIIISFKNS